MKKKIILQNFYQVDKDADYLQELLLLEIQNS